MPLPDAPKPITSNLYRQLNSDRIEDLTPAKFAIVRNAVFTNDVSEDELRRINVAGQASGQVSASGPLVKGNILAQTGEQNSVGDYFIFRPGNSSALPTYDVSGDLVDQGDLQFKAGVWKLEAASVTQSGSSWSGNFKMWVSLGGKKVYLTDINNSAGSAPIFPETVGSIGVHISSKSDLGITVSTVSGTLTQFNVSAWLTRVR